MRALWSLVFLVIVATGATGCHKTDRCFSTCEERQKQLGCHPQEDCKTSCMKLHAATTCTAELKKFEDCFLAKPVDHWLCDGNGLAVVREEDCGLERHLVMTCLENTPPQPPPAPSPAKKP